MITLSQIASVMLGQLITVGILYSLGYRITRKKDKD